MRGSVVPVAVALALAACSSGAPPAEPTAHTASSIQGGTDDTTHQFTVAVFLTLSGNSGDLCSGVLLAPNLVATARHCVSQLSSDTVDCTSTTFGTVYPPSQLDVSDDSVLTTSSRMIGVSQIIVPTGSDETKVCGNDIAFLILDQNLTLPQYVEPVLSPPMTDHRMWATTVTAIGYGVDSASDTTGTSAGTRRIKEDIDLACIPNDATFTDCYADPSAKNIVAPDEFESGDGTCPGDSGSGAFDQTQFDAGNWVAFGVLSRGDSDACVGAVYSRFDQWATLLVGAATQASQAGGYALPTWAVVPSADAGASAGGGGGSKGGCSVVGRREPTQPVPWRVAAFGLAFLGAGIARRRRR